MRHIFVTRPTFFLLLTKHRITTTCREYSAMRDDTTAEAKGVVVGDNNNIFLDAQVPLQFGRYGIEVQIDSVSGDGSKSWVVISRGLDRHVTVISAEYTQHLFPENRNSAGRKFWHRELGSGCGFCIKVKGENGHLQEVRNQVLLQ